MDHKLGYSKKGLSFLLLSQTFFLISGYLIHIGVGRLLGPSAYGIFGVVLGLIMTTTVLVTSGVPTAVSKFVAENEKDALSIVRKALIVQAVFSFGLFFVYLFCAGLIADLLNDASLTPYIAVSALVIPVYALYSVYSAALNGLRQFDKQAVASILYSLAKVIGSLGLVFLGFKVFGAIAGYVLSSVAGLLVAKHYLNIAAEKGGSSFETKKIALFALPVLIFSVLSSLLQNIDLFFVKAMLGTDALTGYYASASTIAKLPTYAFAVLSMALLPMVSKSISEKQKTQAERQINVSLRYALLLLIPTTFLVAATSENLVSLFYSSAFAPAGAPLSILIIGLSLLTLFTILTTIITAAGKPKITAIFAGVMVLLSCALNYFLIPVYGLLGAAAATSIAALIGFILSAACVRRMFEISITMESLVKMLFASLVVGVIAFILNPWTNGLLLLVEYGVLGCLYLAILVLLKEVGPDDWRLLAKMLPGRAGTWVEEWI